MAEPLSTPTHWPQQSPINLRDAFTTEFPAIKWNYAHTLKGVFCKCHEPGRACNLYITSGTATVSAGGPRCRLASLHLHSPSEHLVDGMRHCTELHLVHKLPRPTAGFTYLVVGVFLIEVPDKQQRTAKAFKDIAKALAMPGPTKKDDKFTFHPASLIPRTKEHFRYEGSLTTEPFSEDVSWIVFRDPVCVESCYLQTIREKSTHDPREIQQHARRFVLKNF